MKCVEDICWEKTLTYQGAHQWGRLKLNYQDQTMVHRIDRFVPINGTNVGAQ